MIKLERILCPIDLTPESVEALPYAIALAQKYGADLVVCHFPGTVTPTEAATIQTRMTELVALRRAGSEVQVTVVLASGSDAAAAITREAAEQQADLIVMQSRRRSLAAALLGSVAETVCRFAPCAVLVTHPQEQGSEEAAKMELQRILVAYDFSDCARWALAWGLALAQKYQAELHLLHIVLPDTYLDLEYDPELLSIGKRVMMDIERNLKNELPADVSLVCQVKTEVRRGKPAPEILAYADQQQVDLICLGTHDDSKARGLFGSNADLILRQAFCPTLIAQ